MFALIAVAVVLPGADAHAQRAVPINVVSHPSGATVRLDVEDAEPIGTTPLRGARVPLGEHVLYLELEGHRAAPLPIEVRRRGETFVATLDPLGHLQVTSDPTGARVEVNGVDAGSTPLDQALPHGRYHLRVSLDEHDSHEEWVEVAPGEALHRDIGLEPTPRATLRVESPIGASVAVDGVPRGMVPIALADLAPGTQIVRVELAGHHPHEESVELAPGGTVVLEPVLETLVPPPAEIRIITNVRGAEVRIDRRPVGTAPVVQGNLEAGTYTLLVTAPGYQAFARTLRLEAGQIEDVEVELRPVPLELSPLAQATNSGAARVQAFPTDSEIVLGIRGGLALGVVPEHGLAALDVRMTLEPLAIHAWAGVAPLTTPAGKETFPVAMGCDLALRIMEVSTDSVRIGFEAGGTAAMVLRTQEQPIVDGDLGILLAVTLRADAFFARLSYSHTFVHEPLLAHLLGLGIGGAL